MSKEGSSQPYDGSCKRCRHIVLKVNVTLCGLINDLGMLRTINLRSRPHKFQQFFINIDNNLVDDQILHGKKGLPSAITRKMCNVKDSCPPSSGQIAFRSRSRTEVKYLYHHNNDLINLHLHWSYGQKPNKHLSFDVCMSRNIVLK